MKYKTIEIIMKQREDITIDLRGFIKTLNGFVTAFIAALTASISFIASRESPLHHFIIFLFIQIFFASFFYIFSIISLSNTCRDRIRAIDDYLRESYGIKKLFNNGELGYRHVSKYGYGFTFITFGIAIVILSAVAALIYINFDLIIELIRQFPLYSFIIFAESIIAAGVILSQIIYNITGKSQYYAELYCYLCNNNYPTRKTALRRRILTKSPRSKKNKETTHDQSISGF